MKIFKSIIIIFLLISICISFVGCKQSENDELIKKTNSELDYINIKIISMLNSLNNLSFNNYTIITKDIEDNSTDNDNKTSSNNKTEIKTDNLLSKNFNNIKWESIKNEVEQLNESWSIIALDLYGLKIDNSEILNFSSKLNTAMLNIKNENKTDSLASLANLYESIPLFYYGVNSDNNLQKIRKTQSYVVNAYILAGDINNPDIANNLQKALKTYEEVITNIDYIEGKTYKTNKAYVLLNELTNSLEIKDQTIFYIKYVDFMETINKL